MAGPVTLPILTPPLGKAGGGHVGKDEVTSGAGHHEWCSEGQTKGAGARAERVLPGACGAWLVPPGDSGCGRAGEEEELARLG